MDDWLYSLLPELECKGLCSESCRHIACSKTEYERLGSLTMDAEGYCSFLKDGRCSVYENRPMICRLWGIDETMQCPHGCIPEGGHIPERRAAWLLAAGGPLRWAA